MKQMTFTFLLVFSSAIVFGQGLDQKYHKLVQDFIERVKSKDLVKIAEKVSFPVKREYPIPAIKTKQEFINRYYEVFDAQLTKEIVNSKPASNWSAVGWRGIMLNNGDLWLDYDGKLIGVNHQSKLEEKRRDQLIAMEKKSLYTSINTFKSPILIFETGTYRIRIDDLGKGNYRYASWPIHSKISDKPALVIERGEFIPEGSGGNHRYVFKKGDYTYDCAIWVLTEQGGPPAQLSVYKKGKMILEEKAKRLVNP